MLRPILWLASAVVTALLLLNTAYCAHGSLEEMPTPEQQDKVFRVTLVAGVALAALDAALLVLLARTRRPH